MKENALKGNLQGTISLQYNLDFSGPQTVIPCWIGHITFNGDTYGMVIFNIGNEQSDGVNDEDYIFYKEKWIIYKSINIEFNKQGFLIRWDHENELLWGYDDGQLRLSDNEYKMNGKVEEGFGLFLQWSGHTIRISGIIKLYPSGDPHFASGKVSIE